MKRLNTKHVRVACISTGVTPHITYQAQFTGRRCKT